MCLQPWFGWDKKSATLAPTPGGKVKPVRTPAKVVPIDLPALAEPSKKKRVSVDTQLLLPSLHAQRSQIPLYTQRDKGSHGANKSADTKDKSKKTSAKR